MSDSLILNALQALRQGDLDHRMPVEAGEEAIAYNDAASHISAVLLETRRIAKEAGVEGRFGGQTEIPDAHGEWKNLLDEVNLMNANLTVQFRGLAIVVDAFAKGRLDTRLTLSCEGEVKELSDLMNEMGAQLGSLTAEVRRIAREVGVEGRFGGQAETPEVAGDWKHMSDDLNLMARQLTDQVRDISRAMRDLNSGLKRPATVPAEGETLELRDNLNAYLASAN
jgi:HAMP domain-containing protein